MFSSYLISIFVWTSLPSDNNINHGFAEQVANLIFLFSLHPWVGTQYLVLSQLFLINVNASKLFRLIVATSFAPVSNK